MLLSVAIIVMLALANPALAAPRDRITRPVDTGRTKALSARVPRLARIQDDRGAVDPDMHMDYMVLLFKPAAAQQQELDRLLADQQNPSSPQYRQWLSPEEFGNRFGLSAGDHTKVLSWLRTQGLTVNESGRSRTWVAFSGSAGKVSNALHTPIHRFQVGGETHFANTTEPSVPEALADVAWDFLGLDDFIPKSGAKVATPLLNSAASHFLAPEDFATIYNVAPLYKAGFDGTGQSIVVVGQSAVLLSDLRAFRTRYNLPQNDPKFVPYATDPGLTSSQVEGNLDLEWASAIAPKATIYYIYGSSAFTAILAAISLNVAPVISISYGLCEIDVSPAFRFVAQQGNAQGITLLAASGDAGAAACDNFGSEVFATRGRAVYFPGAMPEATAVGGTQFVEGAGTYWAATNSSNFGSALSYIPEAAWNESGPGGIIATGGGPSFLYPRPAWQTGPGVPNDDVRHVPDISFSAAGHDAYAVTYQGGNVFVFGTSASAPAMAGVVSLLNQYQVAKGFQRQPGLGNINPQLYRLAQSAPSAFHDIIAGDNVVKCAQVSPDCLTGSFGYPAGAGYDMATGLGSLDANNFVTQWNTESHTASLNLVVSPGRPTVNETVAASAVMVPTSAGGIPTGNVSFSSSGLLLGSADLNLRNGQDAADIFFPAWKLGPGTFIITAQYSGDGTFSGTGATRNLTIVSPTSASAIVPSWPATVWPSAPDSQGLSWQTNFTLRETAGVPAIVTGFTVDGKAQPLAQYFPSPNIPANTAVAASIIFRKLTPPVSRTFGFTGTDAAGQTWSREFTVNYNPLPPGQAFVNITATPLSVAQDTGADPSCQWPVAVTLDELGGFAYRVTGLAAGGVNLTSQIAAIFGTPRLDAWGSLRGTVCFSGITPPASDVIEVVVGGFPLQVTVNLSGPPPAPVKISASPSRVGLTSATAGLTSQAALTIDVSDKAERWTATILPGNRSAAWLTASQYSGTGPGRIVLSADGAGYGPGAYRATVVLQSANAMPHSITVPVTFVLGGSNAGIGISGVGNAASYQPIASPGMLLSVFGLKLADSTATATGTFLPYTLAGVTATVNGIAAPVAYVSPTQVNIQVPYEAGTGPGVVGINNNGQIAGLPIDIAPAAPGIFADPAATVKQGGTTTLLVTGVGEVTNLVPTGLTQAPTTPLAILGKPVLPITVTVGGVTAFLQSASLVGGQFGTVQLTVVVPAAVAAGSQPVVVTVNGASSRPAQIAVVP